MAKISANGATEVTRVTVVSRHRDPAKPAVEKIYVMCSDGRILSRWTGDSGTGYNVRARVGKAKATAETLRKFYEHDGYERVK